MQRLLLVAILAAAAYACNPGYFNVYVNTDYNCTNSYVEGRLAAGRDARMSNITLGCQIYNPYPASSSCIRFGSETCNDHQNDEPTIVVGRNAYVNGVTVIAGNFYYASAVTKANLKMVCDCSLARVNWSSYIYKAIDNLESYSQYFGYSYCATGSSVTSNAGKTITFSSQNTSPFFSISSSVLATATTWNLNVPSSSAVVVVNVYGKSVAINGCTLNSQFSSLQSKIVYNFPDATSLSINGCNLIGAVLAPTANIVSSGGSITGQVWANSYAASKNGVCSPCKWNPFDGSFPNPNCNKTASSSTTSSPQTTKALTSSSAAPASTKASTTSAAPSTKASTTSAKTSSTTSSAAPASSTTSSSAAKTSSSTTSSSTTSSSAAPASSTTSSSAAPASSTTSSSAAKTSSSTTSSSTTSSSTTSSSTTSSSTTSSSTTSSSTTSSSAAPASSTTSSSAAPSTSSSTTSSSTTSSSAAPASSTTSSSAAPVATSTTSNPAPSTSSSTTSDAPSSSPTSDSTSTSDVPSSETSSSESDVPSSSPTSETTDYVPTSSGSVPQPPPGPPSAVCGNSVVDGNEQCDGGICCSPDCTFLNVSNICRDQNGECDMPEYCSGTSSNCPSDAYYPSTTPCGSSFGICDVVIKDHCTGSSPLCNSAPSANVFYWDAFNVLSFDSYTCHNGDVEGRLAAQNNVDLAAFSLGLKTAPTDQFSAYDLVVGGDASWTSGSCLAGNASGTIFVAGTFTAPDYLQAQLDTSVQISQLDFQNAQQYYVAMSQKLALLPTNAKASIVYTDGLSIVCDNLNDTLYHFTVDAATFNAMNWFTTTNCRFAAAWIMDIVGSGDITIKGSAFPGIVERMVYNSPQSRTITGSTGVTGNILAPTSSYGQTFGVTYGKVIVGNVTVANQNNKPNCINFASVTITNVNLKEIKSGDEFVYVANLDNYIVGDMICAKGGDCRQIKSGYVSSDGEKAVVVTSPFATDSPAGTQLTTVVTNPEAPARDEAMPTVDSLPGSSGASTLAASLVLAALLTLLI